jgi:carbon monoxide dehydrogenase subunit G
MIEIQEEFEVPANPEHVWKIISNPYEVVGCVPGAALVGQKEDGSYEGTIDVKFGPTSITFQAVVTLELDEAAHHGRLISQARDKRGGTRSKATTSFSVAPAQGGGAGSKVTMQSGVDISGPLASLVESGATFVVKRMVTEFAQRLAVKCGPPPAPAAVAAEVQDPPKIGWWRRFLLWFSRR